MIMFGARKNPHRGGEGFRIKPLAMTYSCIASYTTIGAAAFHFRVRDGIGWGHSAIVAREGVGAAQFGAPSPAKG